LPVHNSDIANILNEVADLLDIQDANRFRVRAYRNAASTIERHPQSMADMLDEGQDLSEIHGIGEDLASKIEEIVETGSLEQLEELRQESAPELAELLKIPGLGPKRVQSLHDELGITSTDELAKAAQEQRIRKIEGFGEKTEQDILEKVERGQESKERTRYDIAEQYVEPLLDYLRSHDAADKVTVAGSYRRRKETVGDLDIIITSDEGAAVIDHFVEFEDVEDIVSQGETRSTVILRNGLQVDLRVVPKESYGAALHYFTGSKAHNIHLRNEALDQGLKVNEYGIFDEDDKQLAGETEKDFYAFFDLPVIPPELREKRGEYEATREGKLPELVTLDDIQGDLHAHSTYSDGRNTIQKMAEAAQEKGYAYLAITDHSPYLAMNQGVDADKLAKQIDEIDKLNEGYDGFTLLKAVEVDILEDGSLDLPDDILQQLDFCICSIHSHFNLSEKKQTERVLRAMDNPNFNIMGHPTGRKIGQRPGYALDIERIMEKCLENGCYLEINSQPDRLDIDDRYSKMAKDMGLKLAVSTDAHVTTALDHMRLGVYQARRGWLEADDVLNTYPLDRLLKSLKRS
jgi:DNA polymerase (family 10)